MDQNQILTEVKKAIDLWMDKTYEEKDFYSHILQIIKDNSEDGKRHQEQLERLIYKLAELRENQRMFWSGHKNKLSVCKQQEKELDKKIIYLLSTEYSIDRFKKDQPIQNSIFQ